MAEATAPDPVARTEALLRLEAAGRLPPDRQAALDRLRAAGRLPDIPAWAPTHPHIVATEAQYGLPKGSLSALLAGIENPAGDPKAVSPTHVTGLFQVTLPTGAPYGLTAENRTNPYLNTNVAAQVLRDLLDKNGGDLDAALRGYKGPEISDADYLAKFHQAYAQYGGAEGPPAASTTIAAPPPAPAGPMPAPDRSTTTTPTSRTFFQGVRSRAGFGAETARGPIGLLGQTFDNLNAGPLGPLLQTMELPAATFAQTVERAGGSESVGNLVQLLTDFFGGRLAGRLVRSRTPRARALAELERLGVLAPGRAADDLAAEARRLQQAAVASAPRTLQSSPAVVARATRDAMNEATDVSERMNTRALRAAREADPAGLVREPRPGRPARTATSPIVDPQGNPITTHIPAQPGRSVTLADVPSSLVADRRVARSLSDMAERFQRTVQRAADAPTPDAMLKQLLRGAKLEGFGKTGLKLPKAEAAMLEVQVHNLVAKMADANPETGVKLLRKAAALKNMTVPELDHAETLLREAHQLRGQADQVAARMQALREYLARPTLRQRMTRAVFPPAIRRLLPGLGAGAAGSAVYRWLTSER